MRRWHELWRRPFPLRRRLVLGQMVVVMMILVGIGVLTVLSLRASMLSMVDTQVAGSLNAFEHSVAKFRDGRDLYGNAHPPGPLKPLTEFSGQAPDNLIALLRGGSVVDSAMFSDGEPRRAPADAVHGIVGELPPDNRSRTVWLDGLGAYRLQSKPIANGEVLVSGVALHSYKAALKRETTIVIGLTALGLILTVLSTVAVVRTSLRPLDRVAETAEEVARTPLGHSEASIPTRVEARDTNPRSEVGRVGHTLNRLLDHVDAAFAERMATDRRMRQFITDASHELRTPVAAILGYAELTRQDSARIPENTEYALNRIEAEAHRMGSLVSDLLTLARLDEGHDLELSVVELREIIVDAVNDAAASGPGHIWLTDLPHDEVRVDADRAKLHQLLTNLLINARTHTPPGTTVVVGLEVDSGHVAEMSVSDDGPGIDPGVVPRLFERFVRADESRSRTSGSVGLGLSIVKAIAESHHGTVSVETAAGATTFRVRLPTVTAPDDKNSMSTNGSHQRRGRMPTSLSNVIG
jgi:two-component system, OmpR family, sensor histidine kinase TrcS